MPVSTGHLPGALPGTKQHLYDLVTDGGYRDRKRSSAYNIVPRGDGLGGMQGNGGKKWGYDASLPSGAADAVGREDPGRYRIYRLIAANRHTWWALTHLPANTYKFNKIAIPKCRPCNGTAEILCPTCKGLRRVQATPTTLAGPCPNCRTRPTASMPCAACNPNPVIVDGYSINKNFANW